MNTTGMIKLFKKLRRKPKIEEVYEFGDIVGQGAFSVVREGTHRETGERVAIKQISKQHITAADMKRLGTEIEIMKKLKHNNIIQLIEVFDNSPEHLYLVMELVKGGELFDKIVDKGQYSEKDACNIVKQIVEAVQYMHDHGVCHRDLKPENLLCAGDDNEELVRIADFGLSKIFEHGEELKTACGTPDYVAPEVLKRWLDLDAMRQLREAMESKSLDDAEKPSEVAESKHTTTETTASTDEVLESKPDQRDEHLGYAPLDPGQYRSAESRRIEELERKPAEKIEELEPKPKQKTPEVLECKPYDNAVDIWSVGVITYILLCGYTPFYANTHQELFQKITNLEYDFPSPEWDAISDSAKDFIQKVLVKDPNQRLTAQQCMEHPWMTQPHEAPKLARLDSALVSLKDYAKTRKTSFLERNAQLSLSAPQLSPHPQN